MAFIPSLLPRLTNSWMPLLESPAKLMLWHPSINTEEACHLKEPFALCVALNPLPDHPPPLYHHHHHLHHRPLSFLWCGQSGFILAHCPILAHGWGQTRVDACFPNGDGAGSLGLIWLGAVGKHNPTDHWEVPTMWLSLSNSNPNYSLLRFLCAPGWMCDHPDARQRAAR